MHVHIGVHTPMQVNRLLVKPMQALRHAHACTPGALHMLAHSLAHLKLKLARAAAARAVGDVSRLWLLGEAGPQGGGAWLKAVAQALFGGACAARLEHLACGG